MSDFISNVVLKRGDGGTPTEAFTAVPGLKDFSGFGQTNPEVDVTDFDSTAREYLGGLPDGNQVTFTFHDDLSAGTNTELQGLINDVKNKVVRNVELVRTDGTNTSTYAFALAMLGWEIQDEVGGAATVQITARMSGAVTVS